MTLEKAKKVAEEIGMSILKVCRILGIPYDFKIEDIKSASEAGSLDFEISRNRKFREEFMKRWKELSMKEIFSASNLMEAKRAWIYCCVYDDENIKAALEKIAEFID